MPADALDVLARVTGARPGDAGCRYPAQAAFPDLVDIRRPRHS
jgi:hypothetical protein